MKVKPLVDSRCVSTRAFSFSDLSAGMDVALMREAYPDTGVANAACVAWRSEVLKVVPGKGRSRNKIIDVRGHLVMYPHKLIVGVAQLDDSGDEEDDGEESDEEDESDEDDDDDDNDGD